MLLVERCWQALFFEAIDEMEALATLATCTFSLSGDQLLKVFYGSDH